MELENLIRVGSSTCPLKDIIREVASHIPLNLCESWFLLRQGQGEKLRPAELRRGQRDPSQDESNQAPLYFTSSF